MKVVLAGTGSAVGKTTISTGIMKALQDENVQPFKVGPDFIDPSYHTIATGNVSRNLDSFFMDEFQIINSFERAMKISKSNMGIIEGVRGLYEGISPISDIGNTASIAKALDAPVVLLMDSRSLVKSAAAVVLGFKALDPDVRIEGVILNKVKGQRHFLKAKESVEKLANVPVIGGIPRNEEIAVEERHLGLVPALEKEKINRNIELWGKIAEEYIDLDALKDIMKTSSKSAVKDNKNKAKESMEDDYHYGHRVDLSIHEDEFNREHNEAINLEVTNGSKPGELWKTGNKTPIKIGVAIDEIFTFYYKETLESLEDNGAKIVPFSPYKDEEEDRPIYGECGGLIYLSESIDGLGMVNAIPYSAEMTPRVQGLNYVVARSNRDNLISEEGDIFRAHEFHYTKLNIDSTEDLVCWKHFS